jgi:hypothetical protein
VVALDSFDVFKELWVAIAAAFEGSPELGISAILGYVLGSLGS